MKNYRGELVKTELQREYIRYYISSADSSEMCVIKVKPVIIVLFHYCCCHWLVKKIHELLSFIFTTNIAY